MDTNSTAGKTRVLGLCIPHHLDPEKECLRLLGITFSHALKAVRWWDVSFPVGCPILIR